MEIGLIITAIVVIVFDVTMWCYTSTIRGYQFTTFVGARIGDILGMFVLYSMPVIVLTIIATAYLAIKQQYPSDLRASWFRRFCRLLWTRPLVVNEFLGVLNGFDLLVILSTIFVVLWMVLNELLPQLRSLHGNPMAGLLKWKPIGVVLGRVAVLPISLLLIPVSRSSPILRAIDIPFEQAVKYHIWLGHLTMAMLLGHVSIFIGIFAYKHHMVKLVTWPPTGVSYLAGLIAFVAGSLMWITALPLIRRRFFNAFYYTHQLYILFFAFLVYHVGVTTAGYYIGGVFLYLLDRFFRVHQSRKKMLISSAKILSNDVVELKIPKLPSMEHSALSFIFINIPSISPLEWHPFSVASSPLDETAITLYVKPFGITSWTQHLHTLVTRSTKKNGSGCPFAQKFSMEGPYGHESNFFLRYKTLLLVAGGIGITPFLAMISDILHRYEAAHTYLPQHVHFTWIVPTSADLHILQQLAPTSIFPQLQSSNLTIVVDVYVTRDNAIRPEFEPSLSVARNSADVEPSLVETMSIRHNLHMACLILGTVLISITLFAILQHHALKRQKNGFGEKIPSWIQASLFFCSLAIGIGGMGGFLITCWSKTFRYKRNSSASVVSNETEFQLQENVLYQPHQFPGCDDLELGARTLCHQSYTTLRKGRPILSEVLDAVLERYTNENVGVLASGPESLQRDVANMCRNHSSNNYATAQILNYHSVSFRL